MRWVVMFKYQGIVSATLVLGGMDVTRPHLHKPCSNLHFFPSLWMVTIERGITYYLLWMYCVFYLVAYSRCWGQDNGFSHSYYHIQSPLLLFCYQLLESHHPTNKPLRQKALSKICSNGKKVSTQSARVGNEHWRKELRREEIFAWEVCCNNIEFQACRWRKRFFCKDGGGWCHHIWQR